MKMLFRKYWWIILFSLAILGSTFMIFSPSIPYSKLLQNQLVMQLLPSYRSFRSISDIVFFPYFFRQSQLPTYHLSIALEDIGLMNSRLPRDPFAGILTDDNRMRVNARFSTDNFVSETDVRYRGLHHTHWNAKKRSFNISFDKENLFRGIASLNLVIPEERQYIVEPLQMYRAKKLGIPAPEVWFSRLNLNGQDAGVYLGWEQWSREWLAKMGISEDANIFDEDDSGGNFTSVQSRPLLSREGLWKSQTNNASHFPELDALISVITEADDRTFEKLIPLLVDLDKFYAWSVLRIISGSDHQNETANLVLLFDPVSGKFTFLPSDMLVDGGNIIPSGTDVQYDDGDMLLERRLFSVPSFVAKRNQLLKEYLKEENLSDDLAFYDRMSAVLKPELLGDPNKFYTNFQVLKHLKIYRTILENNFRAAAPFLKKEYHVSDADQSKFGALKLPDEFSRLPEAAFSRDKFLELNSRFYPLAEGEIGIGPGEYVFQKSIIVPVGVRMVIQPGTTLWMDEGTSIISYGSIEVQGTAVNKVRISALDRSRPWGSMLIVNSGNRRSVVRYADISGGSELKSAVNGIVSTSMLGFYHADVDFENNIVSYSRGEDALNIKYSSNVAVRNNTFMQTSSDAFDCDSCSGIIEGNYFETIGTGVNVKTGFGNTGGDGIDISFAKDLEIRGNTVIGATDKGISVGENSKPNISGNKIFKSNIGIAIKDLSRADLKENIIVGNQTGIELYKKKTTFGPGNALLESSILWGNEKDIEVFKDGSELIYGERNIIESRGDPKPDFDLLLPAPMRRYIK